MFRRKKKYNHKYSQFGRRVLRELEARCMSLGELEDQMERELGCFIRVGYLSNAFKKRKHLPHSLYTYICEFLSIPLHEN